MAHLSFSEPHVLALCSRELRKLERAHAGAFRRSVVTSVRRRAALCLHAPETAHGVSRLPAGVR